MPWEFTPKQILSIEERFLPTERVELDHLQCSAVLSELRSLQSRMVENGFQKLQN